MPGADETQREDAASNEAAMLVAIVGDIRRRQEFVDVPGSVSNRCTNYEFYCRASANVIQSRSPLLILRLALAGRR